MTMLMSISLILAIFTTGTVAGTVFAYANSVMPGLRKTDDRTFVMAVRNLNSSVDNPVFLIISNLALVTQIIVVVIAIYNQVTSSIVLSVIALLSYIMTLLITFLGNLPLNKRIISASLPTEQAEWILLRQKFEMKWSTLNQWRTYTCMVSVFALILVAMI